MDLLILFKKRTIEGRELFLKIFVKKMSITFTINVEKVNLHVVIKENLFFTFTRYKINKKLHVMICDLKNYAIYTTNNTYTITRFQFFNP